MEYSIHPPHPFIRTHQTQLLPNWADSVESVLLLLQFSACSLVDRTVETEAEKGKLRQQFLQIGHQVAERLQLLGYAVDLFDPRTGLPTLTPPGPARLSDVAVAHSLLGYPKLPCKGCSVLLHPTWGSSVYPSTLVSSAPPTVLQAIAQQILPPDAAPLLPLPLVQNCAINK